MTSEAILDRAVTTLDEQGIVRIPRYVLLCAHNAQKISKNAWRDLRSRISAAAIKEADVDVFGNSDEFVLVRRNAGRKIQDLT